MGYNERSTPREYNNKDVEFERADEYENDEKHA